MLNLKNVETLSFVWAEPAAWMLCWPQPRPQPPSRRPVFRCFSLDYSQQTGFSFSLWMVYSDQVLLIEPLLLFHMRQLLSEITSSQAAQTCSSASWRPGPAAPLCGPTSRRRCRRWGREVGGHWWGGADTQLISQVIKCTLHNVHNMWTVD